MLRNDYAHFMTTAGRNAQKKQHKQEKIARTAWELFTTQGYEKVTTRQVAEAADIGTGTLFLYASSKGDLLVLAFEQALRDITQTPPALPKDPREALLQLFLGPVALYVQHRELARHFLVEVLRGQARDATLDNIEQFTRTLAMVLERASTAGTLKPDLDTRQAARNFFGIYLMVLMEWLPTTEPLDVARIRLEQAFNLQWQGLQVQP